MATSRRPNTVAPRARRMAQLQSRDLRDTVREPRLRESAAGPPVTRETTAAERVRRARGVPNAPSANADARTNYLLVRAAIDEESALRAAKLPALHADPFDRMLVAQAIVHGMTILTPDPEIERYGVRVLW